MRKLILCFSVLAALPVAGRADEMAQTPERWALHGQATVLEQFHPAFDAPYSGANSMFAGAQGRETFDATLYAGVSPWAGAEVWADLEVDQGFGLTGTLGAAAFPSAEAYKVGKSLPYGRLQRLFVRQTIDLGGETTAVEGEANQLAGSRTADTLILTGGKISVGDIFDINRYAHDARHDFMNWGNVDAGAFDYAADAWGYSYGVTAEWNRGDWSLRSGVFDLSRVPNTTELESDFSQFEAVVEGERRYTLLGQDGKIKLLGFLNRGRMGSYNDAVVLAQATHSPADTALVRRYRSRGGASVNLEQGITDDLGAFARFSMNDGSQETYEFTDMQASLSVGLSLQGGRWNRKDDTIGLAFETSRISSAARRYFAAGGLGLLIGDGRLDNYGNEAVLETYYDLSLVNGLNAALDYQFIANPAYNGARGPISVLGLRLHGAF